MNISVRFLIFSIFALALMILAIAGCSDRIKGQQITNSKPIVYFVNVPPDGQRKAVNPVVFWVGADSDGRVESYRYTVVREDEMNGMGPDEYVASVLSLTDDTSVWTYLEVTVEDPNTTNEIPVQADLSDPVNKFISQYIFVQAFDDLGLGSDIAFRLVLRNDLPPWATITKIDYERVYINAADSGAVVTGVDLEWIAEDINIEDSLFEFEWRVLGPYTDEELDSLKAKHLDKVFVMTSLRADAKVFPFGQNERIVLIDTTYDTSGMVLDSSIILVDTITEIEDDLLGYIDSNYLRIDNILNDNDRTLNKPLQYSGGWVTETNKVFYDLFADYNDDTTIVRNFLFWVRCRDQANVADLTPDWGVFQAIEPKYERGIIVVDFYKTFLRYNSPYIYQVDDAVPPQTWDGEDALLPPQYWKNVITAWNQEIGDDMEIFLVHDSTTADGFYYPLDYVATEWLGRVELKQLLSHKMMILYNDDITASGIAATSASFGLVGSRIYTAIDAGVNAWLVMRTPLQGAFSQPPLVGANELNFVEVDTLYEKYFGVESMVYSGWGYYAYDSEHRKNARGHWEHDEFYNTTYDENGDSTWLNTGYLCDYHYMPDGKRISVRIEDFIGAVSATDWPDLMVDPVLLKSRYDWWDEAYWDPVDCYGMGFPFLWGGGSWPQLPLDENVRALPEVNWAARSYNTDLLYLYKSYYAGKHFLGEFYNFEGTPVAHRYDRGLFRTVHFSFTPLSIEEGPMQEVINNVFDYLYTADLSSSTSSVRYPNAKGALSASQEREGHLQRMKQEYQTKVDEGTLKVVGHK